MKFGWVMWAMSSKSLGPCRWNSNTSCLWNE